MTDHLNAIRSALAAREYYAALFLAITVPSICGALEANDGQDTRDRFIAWYDRYINDLFLTGTACYALRCSLLHQGRAEHPHLGYERVLFTIPHAGIELHNNIVNNALNLDVVRFCNRIVAAAEEWLQASIGNANVQANSAQSMRLRRNGYAPFIVGVPVIT